MMKRMQPSSGGVVGELVGVGEGCVGLGFGPPLVGFGPGTAVDDDGAGGVGVGDGGLATVEVDAGTGAAVWLWLDGAPVVASDAGSTTAVAGAAVEDVPVAGATVEDGAEPSAEVPSDVPQPSGDDVFWNSEPCTSGKTPALMAWSRQLSPDQRTTAPVARSAKAASAATMTARRRRGAPGSGRKSVEGSKDMVDKGRGTGSSAPVRNGAHYGGTVPGETWITSRGAR
jgi:hypothetical protein